MPPLTVDTTDYTADDTDLTADMTEVGGGTTDMPWYSAEDQEFSLIQNDDYVLENGTHTDIDLEEEVIDLETATATVSARAKLPSDQDQFDGEASIIEGPKLRIEWPSAGADAHPGKYIWQAKLVDSSGFKKTVLQGDLVLQFSSDA